MNTRLSGVIYKNSNCDIDKRVSGTIDISICGDLYKVFISSTGISVCGDIYTKIYSAIYTRQCLVMSKVGRERPRKCRRCSRSENITSISI